MDIDTFYQDGDMAFGMDGRISFVGDTYDEWNNLFGRRKRREAQRKAAEEQGTDRRGQVNKAFPITDDCEELANYIAKAKADINNNNIKISNPKIKRGEKRVLNDYNSLLGGRVAELEAHSRKLKCNVKQKALEEQAFITSLQQITQPQGAATPNTKTNSSNTTKLLLYGVGGLVALTTIFVIIKKLRNN
jgi:hypothetical protein